MDQAQLDDDIEHLRELLTELEEAERDEAMGGEKQEAEDTHDDEMYMNMFATLRRREAEAVDAMMREEEPMSVVEYERSFDGKSNCINFVHKMLLETSIHNCINRKAA